MFRKESVCVVVCGWACVCLYRQIDKIIEKTIGINSESKWGKERERERSK